VPGEGEGGGSIFFGQAAFHKSQIKILIRTVQFVSDDRMPRPARWIEFVLAPVRGRTFRA